MSRVRIFKVPALRFPEFSGEWGLKSIEHIAPLQRGFDLPKQNINPGCVPIVYSNGILGTHSEGKCIGPGVVTGRSGTIGKLTYVESGPYWPHNTSLWVTNFYGNHEKFVYYLYQHIGIEQYASGSGVPTLNRNDVHRHIAAVPCIDEQRKIASTLSLIDERIATQSKIIEELTTLRSALTEKCSRQAGTLFSLADILEETDERSTVVNQYQVLSSTVKGIFSQKEYFNKDIASEDNKGYKVVRRGNVVLSPQNLWMGNINYNNRFDVGIVSPSYKIYSIKKGFNPTFIAALLKTKKALYEYMLASEQGASVVRRNLNVEAFMGITFRIPNAYQQEVLSKAIAAIDSKLSNELAIFEQLQLQKGSLLENMFI